MSNLPTARSLTRKQAIYFRDELRKARSSASSDAEGYQEILYCLERLGAKLTGHISNLGGYSHDIKAIAGRSPLAREIPQERKEWHTYFSRLYDMVRDARNDALHQGAFARHLTVHAVELSLILEDALMNGSSRVGDFMVRDPVCAYSWQPISFIRQTMLINSFSYLPVHLDSQSVPAWYLISDYAVAHYVRSHQEPKAALARMLGDAIADNKIKLVDAPLCTFDSPIAEVLAESKGRPTLILREGADDLLGIVTSFDLL